MVQKCPGAFTPELAAHNARLTQEYNDMTPEQRSQLRKNKFSWGRRGKKPVTPEQRKENQKKASAAWYAKNKEKRAAYQRRRRAEKMHPTAQL